MSRITVKDLESSLKNLVGNWDTFGRNLPGIDQPEISKIKYNKRDDIESQKVALYEKWLEVYPNACWEDVICALREADENTLAQAIENKLSSSDMALSPKQLPIENEAVPSSSLTDPVKQGGEVYDVPESVVDELKGLHDTFVPLATNVQDEIESRVDKGEVTVKSLVRYTGEQRAFPIENNTTPINDSQTFLSAIKPHYNFLNPYLIVMLAIQFLSHCDIAQRAIKYRDEITTFNKSIAVRSLINTLRRYRDHLRPTTNNKIIKIRVNSCFNHKLTIWVVQTLIQTLFPIMHHSELPWYEIGTGSLVLSFIATNNMLLPFIVSCAKKMEFMRLLGIVSVSIGNVYMVVNKNPDEPFSLENSLIEATASDNVEAVKFLLEHLQVNANVKCSDKRLLGLEMDFPHQINRLLMPYKNIFVNLVSDIKKEADECKAKEDDDSNVAEVINSYYEQLQCQHNFLNNTLLSSQSANYLSEDLQKRINQYCETIEEIKREAKINEFVYILNPFIPDSQSKDNNSIISVNIILCNFWAVGSMLNVEQLIKLLFPSVALKHFQWFRIFKIYDEDFEDSDSFRLVFLVPKHLKQTLIDNCKLETIAHELGVLMIEIDDTLAFKGNDDMVYGYNFQEGLQIIQQQCKNQQAIDLLEQIIHQKPSSMAWHMYIASRDINNNCLFIPDPDSTPLMIACCNNNEELVQLLLKYNADPNICTKRNITALIYSSHITNIFQMLLDHGADSSVVTSMKITALHLACSGNLKLVEIMIKKHPSFINMADVMGRTPLWFATHGGNLPVVKRLQQVETVNVNFADTDGSTPLLVAVSQNNLQLVDKLLKINANPNVINNDGNSPLWIASTTESPELRAFKALATIMNSSNKRETEMLVPYYTTTTTRLHACSEELQLAIVDRLLEGKADPNIRGMWGLIPLMGAANSGSVEVVKRLLQAQADPNIQNDIFGETALGGACNHEHIPVIDLLLQAKADPNIRAKIQNQSTPFWRACFSGKTAVMERLLQEPNIDPNLSNGDGDTPLLVASANGHIEVVDRLLQVLADPNIQNNQGETPLLAASANGHIEIVNRLLQAFADPNIQNNHGETPLILAIFKGHWSIVDKLLEGKTDLNISSTTSTGETPLLLAVYQENLGLVKKLLKMNADPNAINDQGQSPLLLASAIGNMQLVDLLQAEISDLN